MFDKPGKDLPSVAYQTVEVDDAKRKELQAEGFAAFPVVKLGDGRSWSGFRLTEIKSLAKELA